MANNYTDIIAFRAPFERTSAEGEVLLPAEVQAQNPVRPTVASQGGVWLGRFMSLVGVGGAIALKTFNFTHFGNNRTIHTAADLIGGISLAAFSRVAIPETPRRAVFNWVKRWSVPLFEIATNIYLNIPNNTKTLPKQLYYCPVNVANAALAFDDVILLATMKENYEGASHLGDRPLPMLEGDSKSFPRMCLNQGTILTAGVALILLGKFANLSRNLNYIDAGIAACSYAAGTAIAQRLWARAESLGREWEAKRSQELFVDLPKPFELRLINTLLKFFQIAYPVGFSTSIVANNGWGYAISALLWGAGNQITRTNFQYRVRKQEEAAAPTSLWSKVKGVWNSRKADIVQNGIFGGVLGGWFGFAQYAAAGLTRIKAGVGATAGSVVAGYFLNKVIDLMWKPSNSMLLNSLFYNTVALSPLAFSYLFLQTKLVANDIFLENSSTFGFTLGIGALIALGVAIGQDRWSQMREGRTDPALTPLMGRALLSYETALNYPTK